MKIKVGQVVKAQGIKGEVKVACFLDSANLLKNVKQLYLQNNPYKVVRVRAEENAFFLQVEGVSDRNAAESLRGWDVFCDKEDVALPEGRYFVEDVLGCRVTLEDGQGVGVITDVLQYGAADVYVCATEGGKEISFPALNDLIASVDTQTKRIVLRAKRFAEVAVTDED